MCTNKNAGRARSGAIETKPIDAEYIPQMAMMPWFPRDFRSATLDWPFIARAAYRELLDLQWDLGSLPNDQDILRNLLGIRKKEWDFAWTIVKKKFVLCDDNRIRNPRLEEHRARALKINATRRKAAQTAARARWPESGREA